MRREKCSHEILRFIFVCHISWKHDDTTLGVNHIQLTHGQLDFGQRLADFVGSKLEHSYQFFVSETEGTQMM